MKYSEYDFEQHVIEYNKGIRINTISFDSLRQMYEGCTDEYDPETEESLAMYYIGKIGTYVLDSYNVSPLNCASVVIKFANGYEVLVLESDVELLSSGESMTDEKFLPVLENEDECFEELTEDEMDFADKAVLAMIASSDCTSNPDYKAMFDEAVDLAIYRSQLYYKQIWKKE